ncbi:hypothetical protein BDY17DRAFT_244910 [Neohortaea acidophila]|uniref:N-acetyltransferase domain-containing protein n=1 Tax=Neohortaea acidophila TaxID=245834 RepID=A0A6A6Q837_9PEZI|nr:uncharacterized protein BDY17DRAFT_244910 [Neohortaea acidophila]KAF2488241.1 hypothetical protein BDY17DRAFT_244910 [Neohortaea acidophila]
MRPRLPPSLPLQSSHHHSFNTGGRDATDSKISNGPSNNNPRSFFLNLPLAKPGHVRPAATTTSSSAAAPPTSLSSAFSRHPLRVTTTSKEDSTRVQLQEERLREELHLRRLKEDPHAALVVTQRIPGFKTSAAFFASLRTNLRLNASPPPSPWSTPPSMRASTGSLPPPSPLHFTTDTTATMDTQPPDTAPTPGSNHPDEDPLAGVPELSTYTTTSEEERIAALKLVADSVAQQRQAANSALIWHPINLAVVVATLALIARMCHEEGRGLGMAATSCTGLVMVYLVLCRWLTQPYLEAAEAINMEWLGENADVIVSKFGEEIIGTVVVDWVAPESATNATSRQKGRKKAWKGEIKGWTVRLKYRGKGVGTGLLEAAVAEARKRGAEVVEFADAHANALRMLPGIYNRKFDKGDKRGREILQDLLQTSPARSKKKN